MDLPRAEPVTEVYKHNLYFDAVNENDETVRLMETEKMSKVYCSLQVGTLKLEVGS